MKDKSDQNNIKEDNYLWGTGVFFLIWHTVLIFIGMKVSVCFIPMHLNNIILSHCEIIIFHLKFCAFKVNDIFLDTFLSYITFAVYRWLPLATVFKVFPWLAITSSYCFPFPYFHNFFSPSSDQKGSFPKLYKKQFEWVILVIFWYSIHW